MQDRSPPTRQIFLLRAAGRPADVRLTPNSGHRSRRRECLLCARIKLMHCSKAVFHSIISVARSSNWGGTVRLSSFAVFRLMINSNFVGR